MDHLDVLTGTLDNDNVKEAAEIAASFKKGDVPQATNGQHTAPLKLQHGSYRKST
ncbi:hypothetical protein [Paenibacillus jiagnxiensis]|uniref:hypothetical protein n=1 Tax=Paenibacillus jiagnxiensis TaxID=3228926 RepID=UPI0038D3DC03